MKRKRQPFGHLSGRLNHPPSLGLVRYRGYAARLAQTFPGVNFVATNVVIKFKKTNGNEYGFERGNAHTCLRITTNQPLID